MNHASGIKVLCLMVFFFLAVPAIASPSAGLVRKPTEEEKISLKIAAEQGDVAAIKTLLEKGIAIDAPLTKKCMEIACIKGGETALILAATAGKPEAVKFLLDSGANPSQGNHAGYTPVRAAVEQKHTNVLLLLLAYGAKPDKYSLVIAMRLGYDEGFRLLLRYGAIVNVLPLVGYDSPLYTAIQVNRIDYAESLLRNGAIVNDQLLEHARAKQVPSAMLDMLERNSTWAPERYRRHWKELREIIAEGEKAMAEGRLDEAIRIVERGLLVPANTPGFERMLGEIHLRKGNEAAAYEHFSRYFDFRPPGDKAVEVRKKLLSLKPAQEALHADVPPPWAVRYQCSGDNVDECLVQCERGHGGSCRTAGILFGTGLRDVKPDPVRAYRLFKTACRLWYVGEACNIVGDAIAMGGLSGRLKVTPDYYDKKKAFEYYDLGCQLSDKESCYIMAQYALDKYDNWGPDDIASSLRLYSWLCGLPEASACSPAAFYYYEAAGTPLDIPRALEAYELACSKGIKQACSNLSAVYTENRGVRPDPVRAFDYISKACEAGAALECLHAGRGYCGGKSIAKDTKRGRALLDRACQAGIQQACELKTSCN